MTRYVVIGAGAIGGGVAGLLADAGVSVVAIARGMHAATIAKDGLSVRMPDRSMTVAVASGTGPDDVVLEPDDVLVLATKSHQAGDALRQWVDAPVVDRSGVTRGTAGECLPVVTALNGVASEDLALRYFDRVIGACVWMPAVFLEPGEIVVRGTPTRGTFHIGPVPVDGGPSDAVTLAALDAIERDWTIAGFRIRRPVDVMPWKYRKLISNIGNVFQALAGADASIGPLVRPAQEEARSVLAGAGIDVVDDETERAERSAAGLRIEPVPGVDETLGGSSWQSMARGTGNIETDYLNGEIARIARVHGLSAPVNAAVTRLARRATRDRLRPGSLSVADIASAVGIDLDSG